MVRPHIVILGAGFGGVYVAKKLKKAVRRKEIDVTIINRTNNFLFTPLLHEVATGALNPRSVAEPLREIFVGTNIRIIEGSVESINTDKREVLVMSAGVPSVSYKYDYLVVATGAESNYYGIPGAAENTLPLKSLRDASQIRNRVIEAFEQAVVVENPEQRRKLLSFAVVGGGATGVELAAELVEFVDGMMDRYSHGCKKGEATITLIHAGRELIEMFAPNLRKAAIQELTKKDVVVRLDTKVTEVTKSSIIFSTGESLPASTVIWSAGVKAAVPKFENMSPTLSGGRLAVDNHFRILGSKNLFAMGDVAAYIDSRAQDKRPLPQLAQVAEGEAATVANNLLASVRGEQLSEFHYRSKGSMVSVGQWFAIGEIYSMNIAGWFTWWMWRTVYLFKFASWKKRIRIGFEWLLQAFFTRDITKIS